MSRRTFSDAQTELLLRLANRTDVTSAMQGYFLNDAILSLVLEFPMPEFEGTTTDMVTSGSNDYTPTATNVWWPVFLKDETNNRPIDGSQLSFIERMRRVAGLVSRYYYYAGIYTFDRTLSANMNVKLWFKIKPSEWSSGNSPLDSQWDLPIIMRAACIGYGAVGEHEKAQLQDVELQNYIARFRLAPLEALKNDSRMGIQVKMTR